MLRFSIVMVIALTCYLPSSAQVFSNSTNAQGISVNFGTPIYGNGVSFYDFNQDGWDDLTIATEGNGIYLYSNEEGTFELFQILPNAGDAKAVVWADFDLDGDADLFVTTYLASCQIWIQDDLSFSNEIEGSGIPIGLDAATFGAAAADYDQDGDIDLYVCNYNWGTGQSNWLLRNDGSGHFDEVASEAGVDNGILPSFMPVWADFDHDGDADLYVINDKLPPNALYENNGDGTFTDVSDGSGSDVVAEAMSNSIADFDGDGDLDIYVAQGYSGNFLLRNDGGFNFTDVTATADLSVDSFCWSALWNDYDNDSSQDLLVNTENPIANTNHFFRNNGLGLFSAYNEVFSFPNAGATYSNARGDIDQNGFVDLVQTAQGPNNLKLWSNSGNSNHWIGIRLIATASNHDAIGVWINVNAQENSSSHYTLSGEGFLGQASQHRVIGLHDSESADLSIEWPSGWTDTYLEVEIDQYIDFTEGETYQVPLNITGSTVLCAGDSVIISAGEHEQFEWSTGAVSESIVVYEPTSVQVTVLTEYGFYASSEILNIQMSDEPDYSIGITPPLCHNSVDGSISVSGENVDYFLVDGSPHSNLATDLNAGSYELILVDNWGCLYPSNVIIEAPSPLSITAVLTEPSCFNSADGTISLEASGGSGVYIYEPSQFIDTLSAGEILITLTDDNGCSIDSTLTVTQPDEITFDLNVVHAQGEINGNAYAAVYGGTPPYIYQWSNGATQAFADDLVPGNYVLTVIDQNACIINIPVTIDQLVTITEEERTIEVFPNPVHDILFISENLQNQAYQLFDQSGRLVQTGLIASKGIDFSKIQTGQYVLLIKNQYVRIVVE